MTIPGMIAQHKEKVYITKLNVAYNTLLEATKRMIEDEGTIDGWGSTSDERMKKFETLLPKYVDVIKTCPRNTDGCISGGYKSRHTTKWYAGKDGTHSTYMLKNGFGLKIGTSNGDCIQDMSLLKKGRGNYQGSYANNCGEINIDINGPSKPNEFDVDYFKFSIVQDGIVPYGSSKEVIWTDRFDDQCLGKGLGDGYSVGKCTAWVIYNKNMDYLHCPDKLGWNKASSCK